MNPTKREKTTGKTIAITGQENLRNWFLEKSQGSWGFESDISSLTIGKTGVVTFMKGKDQVTHNSATFTGRLHVVDQDKFIRSFNEGIGRARGFGFGLLQLVPLRTISKNK